MPNITSTNQPDFDVLFITPNDGYMSYKKDIIRIEVKQTVNEMVNQWKIVMVPSDYEGNETAYEFIDVMTYCEILFKKVKSELTCVIRGFVTNITKTFNISNGVPERRIVIEGENYGKVIRMAQIHYLYGYDKLDLVTASATPFPLFGAYGIDIYTGTQNVAQIMSGMFFNLVIPNFNNIKTYLANRSDPTGKGVETAGSQAAQVVVSPFNLNVDTDGIVLNSEGASRNQTKELNLTFHNPMAGSQESSVYDFMKMYSNAPWNELFVEDLSDSSQLTFRPSPFRDIYGNFVGGTNFDTTSNNVFVIDVEQSEIISYQLSRSDEDVINYFYTDVVFQPPNGVTMEQFMRFNLGITGTNENQNPSVIAGEYNVVVDNQAERVITEDSDQQKKQLEFSRVELFGLRRRNFPSSCLSLKNTLDADGEEQLTLTADPITSSETLNQILIDAYDHNSALENGTILISGREDLRAGLYVRLATNRTQSDTHLYYISELNHVFVPFENFTTQLTVTRGEGYLDYAMNGTL